MAGDLYYFYESDLDKTNIKEFYDSLPSRLQAKFKASLHGVQIGEGNVLQGYRGPSNMCNGDSGDSQELKPSHGLQEIKFWWGARKDFNFIPGVGTIIYTGCRTSQYFSGNLEWSSLYFDSHTGECLSHDKREAAEKLRSRARKAKSKPQASRSNYDSDDDDEHLEECNRNDRRSNTLARDRHEKDFHISKERGPRRTYFRNLSQVDEQIELYTANIANARNESYAASLNSVGNDLFNEGRFDSALSQYQLACETSKVDAQIDIYSRNINKAQVEIDALQFNSQGYHYLNQNRYDDAINMFLKALATSKVDTMCRKYQANVDEAQAEAAADFYNYQGNNLWKEGKYTAALNKYELACKTSKRAARLKIYRVNVAKAQVEIDALKSSSDGDNFFNQGKYNDAVRMYLEAYNKSQITTQKNKYLSNKNKTQGLINKLNMLDALWKQAWDIENDAKSDRSEEATDLFQKLLSESNENLKTFPGNTKFEQFKALAILKIEGNEVFNEGVQSQENGTALFAEAQELNHQEKYGLANEKFKEAEKYLQEALEKFERGSKSDQRFLPCVGFVQDFINVVIDSIKITEQCMFSDRLNKLEITSDNHSGAPSCETDVTGKHINYSQHM